MMGGHCTRFKQHIDKLNERYPIDIMKEMQTKRCPIFWVLGGPCSGKTILCSRLARRYNFHHINLDKLLREKLAKSEDIEDIWDEENGSLMLLSREYVLELIQNQVQTNCFNSRGFLIEGYPRSVSQSEELIKEVGPPSIVFYFHVSLQAMKKRLRHERQFLTHAGLPEEASYIKIFSFVKFFYPLLLEYKDITVRVDTSGDIDKIFEHLTIILQRFLKTKKIQVPERPPVT